MRELYMTDEEIVRNFRAAADKKAQVKILADLNAVDKNVIHNKLLSLGLIDGELLPEKSKGGRSKTAEIDEVEARKLIEKDVPDEQIAKHFGVGISTFMKWRRDKGILRYPKKKGARKTVEEVQKMSVPILDVKQREETPMPAVAPTACQPAKPVDVWAEEDHPIEQNAEPLPVESPVEQLAERVEQRVYERMDELRGKVERIKAENEDGLTVAALSDLLAKLDKLGDAGCVYFGCVPVRGVTVTMSFNAQSGDAPAEMFVELET